MAISKGEPSQSRTCSTGEGLGFMCGTKQITRAPVPGGHRWGTGEGCGSRPADLRGALGGGAVAGGNRGPKGWLQAAPASTFAPAIDRNSWEAGAKQAN